MSYKDLVIIRPASWHCGSTKLKKNKDLLLLLFIDNQKEYSL